MQQYIFLKRTRGQEKVGNLIIWKFDTLRDEGVEDLAIMCCECSNSTPSVLLIKWWWKFQIDIIHLDLRFKPLIYKLYLFGSIKFDCYTMSLDLPTLNLTALAQRFFFKNQNQRLPKVKGYNMGSSQKKSSSTMQTTLWIILHVWPP